jgi:hypothetical protein
MSTIKNKVYTRIYEVIVFLGKPKVFFYSVIWLMIILTWGTIAQKAHGLYFAQKTYFTSWFIWLFDFIPLPSTMTIMSLIFLSLLAKLAIDQWKKQKAGTIIIHLGALILLLGGLLTYLYSYEGSMVLSEGEQRSFISDYYDIELVLINKDAPDVEHIFPQQLLVKDNQLTHNSSHFLAKVKYFYINCAPEQLDQISEDPFIMGFAKIFSFKELPRDAEEERNVSCIELEVSEDNQPSKTFRIFEGMPIKQSISLKEQEYIIELRHKRTYLDFSIKLINFDKISYEGTNKAKEYQSEVVLLDDSISWHSLIKMNEPLRYKGYTFYQASFIQTDSGVISVLAVVKNLGRVFPYIASLIICIGLIIHLLARIPRLIR